MRNFFRAVLPSLMLIAALACGGGGQAGPVASLISSVSSVCAPSSIATNATSQCSATVQGTGSYSSAVNWTTSGGTISVSGLLTASSAVGTITVTAISAQDSSKSSTSAVAVQLPASTITSVAVTCTPSSVGLAGTSQCAAAVQGAGTYSSAVTWSASSGSVSSSGVFTAPNTPGAVTVTATSTQDATKSGTASVSVQSAPSTIRSVSASCTPATVNAGATSQCMATVQGSGSYSPAVSWSTSGGSIDASGLVTAPQTAQTVTVTATSVQDTTMSGQAMVTVQLSVPLSRHVVMVMEENSDYTGIVGDTSAWPNLNQLIATGALPSNYYADSHPSIGNYFMLTTGQLLTTDDNSVAVWNVDNIARRMLAAGVSFRVYAEGISEGYLGNNSGLYLVRHNPFAKLSDIADNQQIANQCIQPFSQFAVDLASGTLPEFSFIIPDVNDDAHNGTPQQADSWLQTNLVSPLANSPAFEPGGDGLLIVDFDEGATSDTAYGGGHVAPVLWGPVVKSGYVQQSATIYLHQSMLLTLMDALGLTNPPGAASTAPAMGEFFTQK